MSGYAATARLHGATVQAGATLAPASQAPGQDELAPTSLADELPGDGIATADPIEDRIHYIRQAWAQTTFFLFDPESWR